MSTDRHFSDPTAWLQFGELYFGIGITPPGQARLGVLSHATLTWRRLEIEPSTCYLRTAVSCTAANAAHVLERTAPATCRNCGSSFGDQDLSNFTHGFAVCLGPDGCWQLEVAPYEPSKHGPFGTDCEDLTRHLGQHTLDEHLASYGPAPYYVVQYQDCDTIRTEPFSAARFNRDDFEDLGNAVHEPVADLNEALRIAHVTAMSANDAHIDGVPAETDGWRWTRSDRDHVSKIEQLTPRTHAEPALSI